MQVYHVIYLSILTHEIQNIDFQTKIALNFTEIC